ncbi:UBX domain-containing protein 1 [Rhynchophorus ferrugineus]|uniref:UBX domain-containing protein 1 n=1 Tax=Rhynchophorus ferrugineus TaxID=354439 RepID=A0A834IVZ4_RHYFE|nr:hypothetical protein GWI33_001665 [Rhynchophorus ferrugineus]
MSNVVDTLVDMGFPKERVELAVLKTGSKEVQTVMEWILSHEKDLDDLETSVEPDASVNNILSTDIIQSTSTGDDIISPVVKSIKCEDCGKIFNTTEEVQFHASKSGHENFMESTEEKKSLTDEERKEQLAKIEAKLKQRRLEREAREKEEALLKEKARIKSGKELLEAKKKYEELEMKKLVEQRKREKEEERLAKQRVREKIEADKLARKAKFSNTPVADPIVPAPISIPEKKTQNYTEVKLQIRLIDGKVLVQNFGIKEPLSAVRLFIEMNRNDEVPFKLMTTFPKKIFTIEDYDKPLESLGLAPAATIIVSKC